MNSNNYENGEYEVNLVQAIWEILIRWKPILLVGILFAFLLPVIMHATETKNQQIRSSETIKESLTEAEVDEVDNIFTSIKNIHSLREFTNNSQIMLIDPYHVKRLNLTFMIENDSNNNGAVSTLYNHYIYSGDFQRKLSEKIGLDSSASEIGGLITSTTLSIPCVSKNGINIDDSVVNDHNLEITDNYIFLSFIVPEGIDEDVAGQAIEEILLYYEAPDTSLKNMYTLKLIDVDVYSGFDEYVFDFQKEQKEYVVTELKTIEEDTKLFTDNQSELLNVYLKESGLDKKGYAVQKVEIDNSQGIQTVDVNNGTIFNKKYMFIGFCVGVFLYVAILFVSWILLAKVGRVMECPSINMIPLLGIITDKNSSGGNIFLYSPLIKKIRDRKLESEDVRLNNTISAMAFYKGVSNSDNISLVTIGDAINKYQGVIDDLSKKYKDEYNNDILVHNLSVNKEEQTNLYKELDTINESVILVVVNEQNRYRDIENIICLLQDKSIKIIGRIGVE